MRTAGPRTLRVAAWIAVALALAACGSTPKKSATAAGKPAAGKPMAGKDATSTTAPGCTGASPYAAAQEDPSTRGNYTAGGLYKPGVRDTTPSYVPNVACIPEPRVTAEPRSRVGNRSPYTVLGKKYHVLDRTKGYVERGTASYYGAKFHGRLTSNQEVYDMYAFSAAHKSLPLPSFARVTNLDNGQSVVVRVNDRGPFHEGRVVDLSYAAAVKLGIVARGTGRVEVRALEPGDTDAPSLAAAPAAAAPRPTASTPVAVSTAAATPATGMDQLVQALPSTAAPAAHVPVAVAPVPAAGRASAASPVLAAGAVPVGAVAAVSAPPSAALPPSQAGSYAPAGIAQAAPPAPAYLLQVASFSSLDNARRALDRLLAAGIAGAQLDDVVSGGRTFWRVRVSPAGTDATELAGRIAGLGFGTPQLVRE